MFSGLTGRIIITVVAVLLCAVGLTSLLGYNKYKLALANIVEGRFRFVLGDIKNTLDVSVNLGVALADLRNLQELLDREKTADDQIQLIEVFDADGTVVFSTDRSNVGQVLPEDWVQLAFLTTTEAWKLHEEDGHVIGLTLISSFGAPLGGVIVSYSHAAIDQKLAQIGLDLGQITVGVIAGYGIVLVFGLIIVLGRPRRQLESMRQSIGQFLVPGGVAVPSVTDIDHLKVSVKAAVGAIDEANCKIQEIDGST